MSTVREEKRQYKIFNRINTSFGEELALRFPKHELLSLNTIPSKDVDSYISKNWTLIDGYCNFTYFYSNNKKYKVHNCLHAAFSYYFRSKLDPNIILYFANGQDSVDADAYNKFYQNNKVTKADKNLIIFDDFSNGTRYCDIFPLPKKGQLNYSPIHCMILDKNTKTWHSVIPIIKNNDNPAWIIDELGMWSLYKYWETEVLPKFKSWKKNKFNVNVLNASQYYLNKYIINRLLGTTPSIFKIYNNL